MSENDEVSVPTYDQLMWPTLKALRALGGSATIQELVDKIIELEHYPEDVQNFSHTNGKDTKLEYNSAWARTFLKKVGAINNSSRGIWVITDIGESLTQKDMGTIPSQVHKKSNEEKRAEKLRKKERYERRKKALVGISDEDISFDEEDEEDWKERLIATILKIDPSAFERLCQLILRESGFTKVEVKGKSGDGGIDGVGILRVNLLSFHVSFQCKRYQGSVGSAQIRDFRGAMIGRSDKGLFITTGSFTGDARAEANRDGAPAIDLIDGDVLCDLLKDLNLGVKTELVEKVLIEDDWFKHI